MASRAAPENLESVLENIFSKTQKSTDAF